MKGLIDLVSERESQKIHFQIVNGCIDAKTPVGQRPDAQSGPLT
jgi:hypothetical protein